MRVDRSRQLGAVLLIVLATAGSAYAQPTHTPPARDVVESALSHADSSHYTDESAWATEEKKTFSALFTGSRYDWLVAPARVQQQGFDRSERSMMAAELARALSDRGLSLPSTYLLERALGEGHRQIDRSEIDFLSRLVGATKIVVPFVGHDGSGNLTVTLTVYRKPDPAASIMTVRPIYSTVSGRKFSADIAPIEAFVAALPELLDDLGLPVRAQSRAAGIAESLQLPDSPESLATADSAGPLSDAARFATLGELAPPSTRASERLFESSLLAARRASDTPEQRFLHAYALYRLNLRPAALRVLQGAKSPALTALAAIVNGNLTGTEALVRRTTGYERLILEIQRADLALAYGHDGTQQPLPPSLAALARRSGAWKLLLERRWEYSPAAGVESNAELKRLLDRFYPLAGESLDELLAAHQATPGARLEWTDVELTVYEHIRRLMAAQRSKWCCASAVGRPNSWDFLAVVESWSEVNLLQSVETELSVRGLPQNARQMLTALDPYYQGRPEFEVVHAQVEQALQHDAPESRQAIYLHSVQQHALQALIAAGGQTNDGIIALSLLGPDARALEIARAYGLDYPLNQFWLSNDFAIDLQERLALTRRALANTQTGVGYISGMLRDGGESVKSEAAAALLGRFLGNPELEAVRAALMPTAAGPASEVARLRQRLRAEPDVWELRNQLGSSLAQQGDFAGAARVFAAYPGFYAKSPTNAIYLSNIAAEAGHMFYWSGAQKEARQLYGIATRYDVGSEAEMTAATHLRLLDGDLLGALQQAGLRAERYPNGISYCNYLSLLHLLGRSQQAWRSFELLVNQPMGVAPWESAIVGHRIAGMRQDGLDEWLARSDISHAETRSASWPAVFLLMWSTNDRVGAPDLPERIRLLAHEPRGVIESVDGRTASYPGVEPGQRFLVSRSDFRAGQRVLPAPETAVESDQPLFARALIAFQRGDFATAVARFDDLAARYPLERLSQNADANYALPEFAYASAKSGDPLKLEPFLAALPKDTEFFSLELARAYFQALTHHDNNAALRSLRRAFGLVEHYFGRTPSMEYQYADTAERLYRDTADKRFRDEAVTWAHLFQKLQPWSAWAYAIEAELAEDPAARRVALVKAQFLDPLSPRLKSISTADMEYAKAQLSKGNPFLGAERSAVPAGTTAHTSHLPSDDRS